MSTQCPQGRETASRGCAVPPPGRERNRLVNAASRYLPRSPASRTDFSRNEGVPGSSPGVGFL